LAASAEHFPVAPHEGPEFGWVVAFAVAWTLANLGA
jgi:hypothetical protein